MHTSNYHINMTFSSLSSAFVALSLSIAANAALQLGPVGTMNIGNGPTNPDGFERQAIVVQGQFPAPPLLATKVGHIRH